MQSRREHSFRRDRKERGNTLLEFGLVMIVLVPMFAGMFTVGMAVNKGIQVSNVARDAVVLMVTAIENPNSGLDLSQTQNQRIIVRAANGLGMASDSSYDPSTTGLSVVILSKVVLVGNTECSVGITPAPTGAPPWNASNCPNYGSYVFAYRVVIGNTTRWTSVLGNPPNSATITSGVVSASDVASNTGDRVASFTTTIGTSGSPFTMTSSQYALISEMYADVSAFNFFRIMSNPVIYARQVS